MIWCSDISSIKITSVRRDSTGEILQAEEFILANWTVSDRLIKLALLCQYGMTSVQFFFMTQETYGDLKYGHFGHQKTTESVT